MHDRSRTRNGLPLAGVGMRLVGAALDVVLATVTAGVGWLAWSAVVWGSGQTPAKQLLGMRVVDAETGRAVSWGEMLVREVLVKFVLIGTLAFVTLGVMGLVAPLLIFGGAMRQPLWDRIVYTVVVDDPGGKALARR